MIWTEAYKLEEIYASGDRGYPIFKGCLKDEPTKLTKDKVRVFQAAPVAFQLLIRKYFLPVARYLQMFPTESEIAVGVNAHGPEWDQLARYVIRYGHDRIVAGDYSKFDTRMPAQATLAAFRILIDLARETGNYTDRDISVMHGIATDCCYPTVAMNGDLLQFFGSNPSGNNITVIINCLVNAINLRCAYYYLAGENPPRFKENVSLITYGDDFKSSSRVEWFNHIAVAGFLARYDQIVTMPDKESKPVKFMHDADVDFLKRKNVYNPELDMFMGALDEESIFKSIHSVLKSKAMTNEEQSATNLSTALREWFFHGEDVYNMRQKQVKQIAEESSVICLCTDLDLTYGERMDAHCEKYQLTRFPESPRGAY
jgi:hypothetical protein